MLALASMYQVCVAAINRLGHKGCTPPHKMAGRRVFDARANPVYHMSLHYHLREEFLRGDVVYDHVFTRIIYGSHHPVHGYGRGHIHTDTRATVGDPS